MKSLRSLAVAACVFGFGSIATCEDVPQAELSAGYAFLYDGSFRDSDSGGDFPLGWQASASFPITPLVGAVIDLSGHYKSGQDDADQDVHGLHGGIRLSERGSEQVTPYAQFLAGVTHGAASVVCWTAPADGGCGVVDSGDTNFSIQSGAGVLVEVSDTVHIDIGGDYRLVFAPEKAHEFRLHVGVAFLIGRK